MKNPINVMLVEDSVAYRKAIARSLGVEPNIELVSEFGTAEIALRSLQNTADQMAPDVILLDLNLPGMSGLEAIPWIKKYAPNTEIIVLTQSDRESDVMQAVSAGASGYLLKSTTRDQLEDSIRTVVEGGATLDPGVARFLLRSMEHAAPQQTSEDDALTERELEVLKLIGEGLSKKMVANQLGISPKTVAIHAGHIYEKLNVPNAPAAVNRAHNLGLFSKEDQA
jgi:two-component system nitrate/nitrite response regulator NarL